MKNLLGTGHKPVSWDESNEYNFNHKRRGTAIVFNMEQVKGDKGDIESRDGSSLDADRTRQTFGSLGFNVIYKENQTKVQVMNILMAGTLIYYSINGTDNFLYR